MIDDGKLWKALSDPTRRNLLDQLAQGPRTTGSLAEAFPDLSRFAIMKHLGILEDAHLITWRKEGRERWNSLNAVPLRLVYERWVSQLGGSQAASLTSLGRLAEFETTRVTTKGDHPMATEIRSFDITSQHEIAAPVEKVWTLLTTRMYEWVRSPYRSFETGDSLELDLRPGGLMVETSGDGETCVWGMVTGLKPGEFVQLTGPCLMNFAAHSTFTFTVEPTGEGSTVTLHHVAIGPMDEGQGGGYKGGWDSMLGNLKELAESA